MRRVDFTPSDLVGARAEEWERWEAKAERARRKLKRVYAPDEEPSFNRAIWKELKEWFFTHVFDEKCAYCEAETTMVAVGHGEHWRPKGGVSDVDGVPVADADGTPHRGYYWLAYEWRNLLPACERCNSGQGKGTRFPVRNRYAFSPDDAETVEDLDAFEDPLLLHPFGEKDPIDHIGFEEHGQPVALSDEGGASIKVYNLARDPLNRSRSIHRRHMSAVATRVVTDWMRAAEEGTTPDLATLVRRQISPDEPFILARTVYLWEYVTERLRELSGQARRGERRGRDSNPR